MKNSILILLFILSAFLASCDPNRVYEENIEIPEVIWNRKNIVPFVVNIEDTLALHNVFVNVRVVGDYAYSNLFLFITTEYPNGTASKDTVECILADEKGDWLGNGSGEMFDNQILFKSNVRFKQKGKYTIKYEQGMRVENLPAILDVGLRIEKVN